MRIKRFNTTEGQDPLGSIPSRYIAIEFPHQDPEKQLCIPDFEIPASWSNQAGEYLARHYVRRTGVPARTRPVAEEGVPEWLQRREADADALAKVSDRLRYGSEISYRQLLHRLVGAWCYWGWTHGYFDKESDARAFYDEYLYLIATQQAMPASPQWVNTGLHWAYGIAGDANGAFYVDAASGELQQSDSAYERPQHHHCFIQGVRDELSGEGGITDLWQREMRVFKHGSGSGANLSCIRSASEPLSSGLPSAGLVPFMEMGEKAAAAIHRDSTRKGHAQKLSLIDVDHPDVRHVLHHRLTKHREAMATEIGVKKLQALHQQIWRAIREWEGTEEARHDPAKNTRLAEIMREAAGRHVSEPLMYHYIQELRACGDTFRYMAESSTLLSQQDLAASGVQVGFRLSDAFLRAACQEQEWSLKSRTERKPMSYVNAQKMLDELAYYNWASGDGLVQFSDNIGFWHGCKMKGPIQASSPGGEFQFLDDSACDVSVSNLLAFVNEEGQLAIEAFQHAIRLQTIMCDISITMAQYPSADIALNTYRYRPIGLSFCNLAPMLMRMGYAYDSDEARAIAGSVAALMTGTGYCVSAEIARELGGFEAFSEVKESMMQLMWQHHEAAFGRTQHLGSIDVRPMVIDHATLSESPLSDAVQAVWDQVMIRGDEFGYSNAQISLLATNPNVMQLMDALSPAADALSVPPLPEQKQRWAAVIEDGMARLGYPEAQRRAVKDYLVGRRSCLDAPAINAVTLQQQGFSVDELALVEEALERGHDIYGAFDPLHLGERFCRDVLKLNDQQLHDADFDLLAHLGFDQESIDAFTAHCLGHDTLDDAPYLRDEDKAIFAVADPARGRAVAVEAQIQMAATLQPYVSGGIAMTIRTPYESSVIQHRRYLLMAWQLGLKQLHLSRDMVSPAAAPAPIAEAEEESPSLQFTKASVSLPARACLSDHSDVAGIGMLVERAMQEQETAMETREATHQPMPQRRHGYVQHASIAGVSVCHRTEEYEDGRLGAVRLHAPQLDASAGGNLKTNDEAGIGIAAARRAAGSAGACVSGRLLQPGRRGERSSSDYSGALGHGLSVSGSAVALCRRGRA